LLKVEVHDVPPADQPVFFVLICLLVRSWFHTIITNIGRNRQTTLQWHVGSILFIWCGFGVKMAGQTHGLLAMSTDTQTLSLFRPRGSHDLCAAHNHKGHGLPHAGFQSIYKNSVAPRTGLHAFSYERRRNMHEFVERFILDSHSVFR
jgi:hypothetical protein